MGVANTNKAIEIKFLFHGKIHYLIDQTNTSVKRAISDLKRDYDGAKIIEVKKIDKPL